MTLDEAIKHAEEVAEENSKRAERIRDKMKSEIALSNAVECETCAEEHRQLAEWLKGYKRLLEQPTSDDCVSRTQALKELKESAEHHANDSREEVLLRRDRDIIRALPPVTPTRKVGKWIKVSETEFGIVYQCSECGRFILTESIDGRKLEDFPYCHFGAEMKGESNNDKSNIQA